MVMRVFCSKKSTQPDADRLVAIGFSRSKIRDCCPGSQSSRCSHGEVGPNYNTRLVFHCHVAHELALRFMGDDCAVIRYEDLCESPVSEINRVVDELGLPRRREPIPLPDRFAKITNSNRKYLSLMPEQFFGTGSWTQFGYDLGN